MSPIPGTTVMKDPQAKLSYEFDWSAWLGATALLASSSFAITGPDAALTFDNAVIVSGSQKTVLRLIGGTVGKRYTVTNHIATNESPVQEDDKSIFVRITQQ